MYPPPPYAPSGYPTTPATNGLAVAALILGIVGWLPCGVGSLIAVVLGFIARNQIREARGRQAGEGLALAGIILGFLAIGLWVLIFVASAVTSSQLTGRAGNFRRLSASISRLRNPKPCADKWHKGVRNADHTWCGIVALARRRSTGIGRKPTDHRGVRRPRREHDARIEIARLRGEIERLVRGTGENPRVAVDSALESVTRLQVVTANIDACGPPSANHAGAVMVAFADARLRGHADAIERGMTYTADNQMRLLRGEK